MRIAFETESCKFSETLPDDSTLAEVMDVCFRGALATGYTVTREDFRELFQEEFQMRLEATQ